MGRKRESAKASNEVRSSNDRLLNYEYLQSLHHHHFFLSLSAIFLLSSYFYAPFSDSEPGWDFENQIQILKLVANRSPYLCMPSSLSRLDLTEGKVDTPGEPAALEAERIGERKDTNKEEEEGSETKGYHSFVDHEEFKAQERRPF
ncbi:hypothetical protein TorRG33x02_263740 [Trema orientale]|uniref:Uncharacterized protein n=1 Tax=Trema orientale TaxID=63057 RepID=A0A2P5D3B2_TREOI|nr:hypothetical protein TorRG33x02_263740 [Trema orientale]